MENAKRNWLPVVVIAVALWGWQQLPPVAELHWSAVLPVDAQVDHAPRGALAFVLPGLALLIWLAFRAARMPWAQPLGRKLFPRAPEAVTTADQFSRFDPTYELIAAAIALMIVGIHAGVIALALQHNLLAARLIAGSLALCFVAIGNVMPRLKPNWVAGVRLDRALADPQLWRKSNLAFGSAFTGAGIVALAVMLLAPRFGVVAAIAALGLAVLVAGLAITLGRGPRPSVMPS